MNIQNKEQSELIALNIQVGDAEKKRDAKFMNDILSDKLVFRRADEVIVNKASYLEALNNPANTYSHLNISGVT